MIRTSRLAAGLGFLFVLVVLLPAAAPAAEMSETVLPNGLRVVLRPVATNPVVCSAVLVRAGVAWEPEGLSGASHFLEHLLFNGTESRTQEQLYADVDRIGAFNNATTRSDHTLFLLLVPREHLDAALEIQSDMLLHSTLPVEKFEKERGIVMEELGRAGNNPSYPADAFFDQHLYAGSPYARPVLGTAESIRDLDRDAVLDYYRDRYRPERMVVFLAGDFDPADAMERIRKYFGAGSAATADESLPEVAPAFAAEPPLRFLPLDAGRSYLRVAFPAPTEGEADAPAFALWTELVGGGDSSPLGRALKGGEEPAVFDFSLHPTTTGTAGALVIHATLTGAVPPQEVIRRTAAVLVDAVRRPPFDPGDLRLLRETRLTEEAILAEQVHYYAMLRASRLLRASAAELEAAAAGQSAIDIAELRATAERHLLPLRAVVAVAGPTPPGGDAVDLAGIVAAVPALTPAAGTDVVVLDNGLTLVVNTDPDSRVFAAHLFARNRSAQEPAARPGLADLMHRLLLRGTLARDGAGVEEALRAIGAQLQVVDDPRFPFDDYRTVPTFSFIRLEARAERAGEALGVLAEIIRTPRFDPVEIEKSVAEMQDLVRRREESSSAMSGRLFFELVAPEHPFSRPIGGTPTSLAGVRRQDLLEFHRQYFAPANLILVIRSSGDREAVVQRAREIFGGAGAGGGWAPPAQEATSSAPTALAPAPPLTRAGQRAEETLGKRQSSLRLGAVVAPEPGERAALTVANLVLSDRLQMEVRERQGLAYSIGSRLTELGSGRQLLTVTIGTASENLELAEAEIRRLASELAGGPIPEDEIARVVAAHTGRILMRRLPRINQAYYDGLRVLYGTPTDGSLELLAAISELTPEAVAAAARRYLSPADWHVAIVR